MRVHTRSVKDRGDRDDTSPLEPFLKWPGGKRNLLPRLTTLLPTTYRRYFEPFLGGGALFFHLRPEQAVLSDKNSDLIACYRLVRDDPERLISRLGGLRNSRDDYYRVRNSSPRSPAGRAARFIYLVNLSFNGIYRVNFHGGFNVPYGHRPHRPACDADKIQRASRALASATLLDGDFEASVRDAGPNDLVYLDPPYTVAHNNNGFIRYNSKLFSWDDQERLARMAVDLADRGCHVIVSNACHAPIKKLYPGFVAHQLQRTSTIAGQADGRNSISEYVFTSVSIND